MYMTNTELQNLGSRQRKAYNYTGSLEIIILETYGVAGPITSFIFFDTRDSFIQLGNQHNVNFSIPIFNIQLYHISPSYQVRNSQ